MMHSLKFRFGLLTGCTIIVALLSLGCLSWYELRHPLYTGLSRLQQEIHRNPQIYGQKAYILSIYISHILFAVSCMLIVVLAPFVLVFGTLASIIMNSNDIDNNNRSSHSKSILLVTLIAFIVILFAANTLLIGSLASAVSTLMSDWQMSGRRFEGVAEHSILPHSSLNLQRASLNEDLHLLVTRAKFRNAQAVQLMDDIHTLFECCGVRGSTDWIKPPYEQSKSPVSCTSNVGCTYRILRAVSKHRLLSALASASLLAALIPTQWISIMFIGKLLVENANRKLYKSERHSSMSSLFKSGNVILA